MSDTEFPYVEEEEELDLDKVENFYEGEPDFDRAQAISEDGLQDDFEVEGEPLGDALAQPEDGGQALEGGAL